MVLTVVLSAFLCCAGAAPSRPIVVPDLPLALHAAPAAVVAAPVAVVSSQSHAQDELGQYSYSYSNPLSSKVETKTVDGVTRGGYSYLDSHGLVQSVNYVSDDLNGFRVAASNLPLGPVTPQEDEPLVAHEKAKAIAALQEAAVKDAVAIHENEILHAPAVVIDSAAPVSVVPASPVAYSTPSPPVAAPVSSLAPPTYVTATPEVYVTPAPVVHVTPAPYRHSSAAPLVEYHEPSQALLTPTATPITAHSYATVELDSSDIPAPAPAPGAYFRTSPVVVGHAPEHYGSQEVVHEEPALFKVSHPAPTPVAYAAPAVHVTPEPHVPAPAVPAAPVPVFAASPQVVHAPVAVVSSQSHAQDELGQYSYSYSNPLSSKVETKTVDGVTRGGYSYLDSHGLVQSVNYVSDDVNGFRVAASNLPTATLPVEVPDSEDVAAAKQLFFAQAKESADHVA